MSLVASLRNEASEYETNRVEAALFVEAADRIESLEDELAQTKRNIIHVEDCWADVLNALGDSAAELAAANATIASVRAIAEALKDCDCDCCIDDPTPAALLAAVLAEAKKPRPAAGKLRVLGEDVCAKAFLSQCDLGESTT